MKGIFGKLRRALALMMACMMLLTSVAYAEPGASVSTAASTGATLTLPAMMKVIGDEAFKGDTSVQNVVLPDGATTIGAEAFAGCTALQSVTIPDSVTDIADSAFDGCGDFVIICSSGSKAAVWAKAMGYRTQFTDQAAVEMVWDQSIFTAYPADQGGMFGCVVLKGKANGYDEAAHGAISWELERIDENQDVQLDLYLIEYGATAFVRMPESYATGGSVTYRLTAKAEAFTESHEFTVELAPMPDTIPTGIGMKQTHFEIRDTLDFGKDDLYFVDGGFDMDEACVALSIPGIEDWAIWTENEAEFTDDGFRVTFTKDGRYEIPVWMLVNNALCYDEIAITVGTGVCENANVSVNLNDSNQIFCGAENLVSLGTACLNDFVLLDGETIEWSIESVNGEGLIDLSCAPADWNKYFAEIRVDGVHGEPGTETFRMTAAVGETEYSETFEIILLERPETLPTDEDVLLENDVYHVNIGDTFEFTYDRIGLDETNLPEGMSWQAAIWNTESSDYLPVEWTDEGFRVTFDQEGTHTFYAAVILTADYSVGREFTIIVGDGFENDLSLSVGKSQVSMYLQEHDEGRDHWLTDFDLEGFDYENPPMVDWKLEILEHDGEEPAVYARMDISEEGPWGGLVADGFTGETGSVTFRVHCIVERVHDFWQDVTVHVELLPENLPGGEAIELEQDYHELNVGDTFEFTYEDFGFDASSLPEGMSWEKEIHDTWLLEQNSDFKWIEDGFRVTFTENGRFVFCPAIRLGANLHISRPVTIKVGDGVSPDFAVEENYVTDTLYIGGHDSWIISVGVYGYTPPAGTDLCWELYPAEGQGEHLPVEAFDNGTWSDGAGNYEIMVNANPASDEPGEAVWILKAVAGDEVVYEKTLTLKLVAKPDDLNIVLDVTQDEYHVQAGELFRYNFSNIQEGEGFSAPKDATTLRVTYINDHFWDNETFQWVYEDGKAVGLEIVFDQPGRYMFESGFQVSNCTEVEQIVVIVDEDPTMYVDWGTNVLMTTLKGSTQIGELFMDNFFLHDGEEVKWEVRKVSGDADVNMYAADEWDMGCRALLYAELNPGAVGDTEATFEIAAYGFDGREYTRQFTIFVKDGNVELPGEEAITVPQEVYYLNVGDRFTFSRNDFDFDESAMPEGYTYNKQIWGSDALDRLETMEWFPGGFTVTFDEPGRYEFRAAVVYAAETMVWKDVFIIVGDGGINDADLQCRYYIDTVYAEGSDRMQSSYELTGYNIIASDKVEWKLERSNPDAERIVDLRITWYSDDNSAVDINAAASEGVYGSDEYILTCIVNGVEIASVAIPVTAAALPENMPTELRVDWDYIHVNQGDEVYFGYDMFETADGEIPEGVFTDKEIWFGDGWENSGEFEWVEGGFRFVPHRDGVYTFTAAVLIGNYTVEKQITIVVGEGVPEGLEVHWSDNAFIFTKEDPNDMWVTEARVQDYEPIEGYEIDWYAERVSETNLLEVYCENMDERGTFANFHAYRISEETGEEIWRIVGEIRGHRVVEREITFRVVDSAEGLPTRLWVDSEEYNIAVGQEFVFTRDMFGPEDGEIPEDICPNYDLWIDDRLTEHAGFEWIENGFRFVPDADGRYDFHVALLFGNYQISKRVVINVGTGNHPDFGVEWDDNSFTIYKGGEWTWITDGFIQNYTAPAGCEIEWRVERVTEGEPQLVNLRIADEWNNGLSAGVHGDPMSDQSGVEEWRIVAQAGEEIVVDRTISIELADLPENLPTEIIVEDDDIYIGVGDEFVFDTTMFYAEGEIPEGMRVNKEIHLPDYIAGIYGFDWTENGGFYVKPDHDNRFSFDVMIEIGNYRIYRTITVTVGTGVHPDRRVDFNEGFSVIYRNGEHSNGTWVMDAYIGYYTPPAGCEIEWSFEYVGEEGTEQLDPYFRDIWDNNCCANISVRLKEQELELGEETWRVIAQAGDETIVYEEFTVSIEDVPEGLPTELWVDWDYIHVNQGDEVTFSYNQFDVADSDNYAGPEYIKEIWAGGEFEWIENGIRFVADEDGAYFFTVAVLVGNYTVERQITIIVGEGVDTDFSVNWDDNAFVLYKGHDENWMTNAFVNDFDLPEGWEIEWYVDPVNGEAYQPIHVWINETQDSGRFAGFSMRENGEECGEAQWIIRAIVNGRTIVEREFTVELRDLPEDMPTELRVENDIDDYHMEVGQEFWFTYEMFDVNNGVEPEGVLKRKELWVGDYLQNAEGFKWMENGIRFVPTHDGRYNFEAAVKYGSHCATRRITITVGTGVHPDFSVDWEDNSFIIFKDREWTWIANADIHNYAPPAGCDIEWFVECKTEGEDQVTNLRFADIYNGGLSASFHGDPTSDQNGEDTWRIVAQAGEEIIVDREITLTLMDLPENIPADIWVENDDIHIEVGEEFVFDTTMFEVGEGEIPEGTRAYKFVDVPENVYDIYGFDWTDNGGFYVKPDRDGRFNFKAAVEIGNHRIYRTITVTVGTGEQNYDVHWNDAFFSIYRNYEHNHDSWVLDANINGYTPAAGCQIVWSVEPVGCGEDGIWQTKARIDNIWDDDRSASVVVHLNEHELGDDTWRVVARAGEDEIVSREFTVYIEDLPETFPTELWIDCDYFEINPGDEFSMFNSQFGPANGELSEDQRIEYEFWLNDRIQHENEFEWLEDGGFRFRPMQDGVYTFDVAIRISNYAVAKTVTVKVGSGVNPDFGVDWDEGSFTMYTGQNHDMWVMDAHIHDYDLPAGMSIEWYIEQPYEDWLWETDAYIGNVWDDGYSANISVRFADPNNQSCGADTWRVIAKVGDEVIVERDFSIWIEELPEGIFTAPWVEQDYYEIQPGDEISMNYDQIGLDGGSLPEGVRLDKHIWIPEQMGEAEGFEWTDNGFRFQPMEDGLYSFEVAVSVGNYVVSKRIVVVVGEGKELKAEERINSCQLYKGGHDVWVMDVTVNDYVTGLDWSLTRDNEEEPLYAEPFFVWNDSDGYGNYSLRVNANQMSDESGSNLWYLRATLAGEVVYEYKLPLSLVDYPEEGKLNIDVAAHETEYRVEVGETFSYAHDNVEEGKNFVKPDDAGLCRIMYLNDSITGNESFTWTETGFDVVFTEPGRYAFEHGLQVNNYTKTVWITVIVGDDLELDVHCKSDMVLSSAEQGGWFAYLTLDDFHLVNDEWVEWRTELLTETENPVAELYVDNTQDGGRGANVHFRNVTGEVGEATYRIIAYGWDGREYFTDLTVRVVNADELELPGSELIEIGQDYYHFDLDTEFNLSADCFTVNESLLPEGFGYYKELWGNERIDGLWGTYWDEEGIHVHFGIEGRFELTAAVYITADYIITRPIVIEVGEVSAENAELACVEYINAIYPSEENSYIAAYELVGYDLVSTDDVQWEIVRFTDEFSPVTPIVDLSVGWISDGRNYVDIYAGPTHGEYDTELYDLICTVNGEKIAETRIEANVRPDENLPTELWTNAENDRHYINPWDVFEFHTGDFDINGEYPEGVYTKKEVWVDWELQNTHGFEWLEDGGFRVQPDHDATYVFTAVVKIGTRCVTRDVILIVGNGDNSKYWVDWQDHAGELYLHHGDIYVSGVYINDYFLPDGMEVEWDVFRVDEDPSQVIWLEARDHRDGGLGVNLIAGQDNGDCGMNTWRVVARVGDEVLLERNFELYVSEMPENMPSNEDMWVELDEYHLEVGETLDFNDSLFDLIEGDYDMGGWWKEVWVPEEWNELGVDWYDHNAFRVTFPENGRYTFRVAMLKSNVSVSREIRIIVGDGVPADAKLDVRYWLQALYVGENEHLSDSCDGVNVRLKGYNRFENEYIQWEIKNVNEDGDYCVEAQIGALSEDSLEADIQFFNINAVGEETFHVTAATDCGVYEAEFTITVTDDLSGLPTYFEVDIAEHYGLGDSYCFSMNSISMDDDGRGGYQFHDDLENIFGNDGNEVWWDDNGLNIVFRTENTLEVPFRIEFGNYALEKTYVVTIGDGLRDDCHIQMEQFTNTVYIGCDDNMHLGWARLQNYTLLTGEEIEWTLEKINVSDNEPMELCFGDPKEYGANIHICNLTGEEGWVEYELTGTADRYSETHTIWVQVVNAPDNLPTEIWLENDVFMFSPGEQLHLNADFWAADGEVPENAYVSRWYEPSDAFNKNAEIEWHEDGGFTATLNADGRYTITACMQINNHSIRRDIIVSVGDGYNDDMRLVVDQRFTKGFNFYQDEGHHGIASVTLEGYQLASGEQIEWDIEGVDCVTSWAAHMEIGGIDHDGLTAYIDMYSPSSIASSVTYRVTARTSFGQEFTADITYEILEAEQYDLPDEMTGVETEVHLEAGDTYVFDPDAMQIGWEGGEIPDGVEYYLEFWDGYDYLQWLPGYEELDNGGFKVTFNRDGQFTFRIAWRIGTNHFVYKDVTITIGEGMVDAESIVLNHTHYMQYILTDVEPGTTVRHSELYLDGYTPYEGEQILWELYYVYGDPECASLQIGEVWDNGLSARIDLVADSGSTGWVEYELWVTTESGYRHCFNSAEEYYFIADSVSPVEMTVSNFWVDDVSIEVGEEYTFNAWTSENSHVEGLDGFNWWFNTEFVPDDCLASQESYYQYYDNEQLDDVFTFTPDREGRYNIIVRLNFGGRIMEDSFILTVGDGVSDDVAVELSQWADTIYLGGESDRVAGRIELWNYNFIGEETARWAIERIDENEGCPVELYWEPGGKHGEYCDLYYMNIQDVGSVTYRVMVDTDAGYYGYRDITLEVVEMPEDMPTGFSFDLPSHYEIGGTLRFNGLENIRFDDGEIPEGMEADVMVIDLQDNPIWHENDCSSGNGWFEVDFGRNGRYSVEIRVQISNYVLTRMLDITVGTGFSDYVHIGAMMNDGWFYPNQGDAWVGDFYLNDYTLLGDETVEWTWERTGGHGDVDVNLYMADSWDGGLRMKLHSAGTGEEPGWADYLLTVRTSHGFVQTFEFQVNVNEMPENMSMELTGADEYIVMLDQHNEIYAEDLVQIEGGMPDGNRIRYIIEADDELLNAEGFDGWYDSGMIGFFPTQAASYTITVKAMAGNCLIGEKQVELIVCNPEIELFNGSSVVYEYEYDETWVADASLVNVPEMYADQIEWSLELPENFPAYRVEMHLGGSWDDGRSVGVLASYNNNCYVDAPIDSMTCRLIARISDVYETSVELTVQVAQRPDNLPHLYLDSADTDVWFEVGTPVTFDSTWFELVDGTIPEDAVVHDELWFCDDGLEQLDGFEMWENNRGIDGVGFSVTFNEPGRYHFYLVRKLNNITWAEEFRITVGDVQMTDLPMEIDLKTDTLYADCGDYYMLGEITIPGFTFFDADYVSGEVTCLTDTDLAELYVDEDYETGKIELWVSTGSETGTATYRVALMLDGEEIAATDITLNVVETPDDLPTDIGYRKEYLLNEWGIYSPQSPGCFTVRLDDFYLITGYPEALDDYEVMWSMEVNGDEGVADYVWHEDGLGFDMYYYARPDGYGSDHTVYVYATINNYQISRWIAIYVDGGAPK